MKRWWIPTLAILGFFILISALFKTLGPMDIKPINNSKIESAMNSMNGSADETRINFENKIATTGEKVPNWGAIKKLVTPKTESLSFKGAQGKAIEKVASKDSKKGKKKKKKVAEKKKKNKFVINKIKSTPTKPLQESISDDSGGAEANTSVPQKQKDKNAIPETLEDWEEFVLNPPSIDNLMVLVKYHQARLVSDDIFYKLSEKMIHSRNDDVRRFGIIALNSSPGIESFVLLSYVTAEERTATLQSMISSSYQAYASIQYLSVLGSALQSPIAGVRYQATISLRQSAVQNIKRTNDASAGRGRSLNLAAQRYQSFVTTLRFMASNDPSGDVQNAARRTLDLINTLTASTNVVASN